MTAVDCEHFIYALFNGVGYRLIKTPNLHTVVDGDQLTYLLHIGDNATTDMVTQVWFPHKQFLAVSYIHPTQDQYARKGIWNHTIVISTTDYFVLTQPAKIFEPYFIKHLDQPPDTLLPLLVR